MKIEPNAYYSYKNNESERLERFSAKQMILDKITEIYHALNGVPGYRMMTNELKKYNIFLSENTVYSYMSKLGLKSIVRRKYMYEKGEAHKVFTNLLKQNFTASKPNEIWCTDFTYSHLSTGEKRYNCTILDLFDRSVIASLNSKKIDSELAINTLKNALKQTKNNKNIILHSDQGSQYTSKKFTDFYSENNIVQSMSRAVVPMIMLLWNAFTIPLKMSFIIFSALILMRF